MKKFFAFAIVAVLSALCLSSCTKETGQYVYIVDTTYDDNGDRLITAMDKGFQDAGFTKLPVGSHAWYLTGEKNSCNQKAIQTFKARAQYVDEHRDEIPFLGALSALKGCSVMLKVATGGENYDTIATYTFVKEDAK